MAGTGGRGRLSIGQPTLMDDADSGPMPGPAEVERQFRVLLESMSVTTEREADLLRMSDERKWKLIKVFVCILLFMRQKATRRIPCYPRVTFDCLRHRLQFAGYSHLLMLENSVLLCIHFTSSSSFPGWWAVEWA